MFHAEIVIVKNTGSFKFFTAIVAIKRNPDQISQNPATGRSIPHRKKVRGEREKALDRLVQSSPPYL